MLARHKHLMDSYERVQDFLSANPPPTAAPNYGAQRQELDETIARLNALLGDQSAGQKESRDDTRRQKAVRKTLREMHLAPISRIAKTFLPNTPTIQKALSMPSGQLSTRKLIAEAVGMRTSAARYADEFIANGRPADFLAQLDATIEALRQTQLGKARSVGRHVGAKAGLAQELARGRRAVQMLDAMVLDAFSGNQELLAKWKIAKRVQDLPGTSFRATGGTADENTPETEPVAA
jgi:thioester reductase-like protein